MFGRTRKQLIASEPGDAEPAALNQVFLPQGINHINHDTAAAKYGLSSSGPKFYVSSFDYVKAPHLPLHPAFTDWAKDAGPAYITVIWREDNGATLPFAVAYETKQGTRIDELELSADGTRFSHEHIGDIVVEKKKHLLRSAEEVLMFAEPGHKVIREVRGGLFKVKGGSTMFPSQDDPGIHLLTQGFTEGNHQSIWEVQEDKSLLITEQGGNLPIGIITAENTVNGYMVQGPVTFSDDHSRYHRNARQEFITHALLALMIMPVHRPASMSKMLWWLRKLGGVALKGAGGL